MSDPSSPSLFIDPRVKRELLRKQTRLQKSIKQVIADTADLQSVVKFGCNPKHPEQRRAECQLNSLRLTLELAHVLELDSRLPIFYLANAKKP